MSTNTVFLKDLPFMLRVGKYAGDCEGKLQPVIVSFRVENVKSIQDAAASDDISQSLDYGKLYKNIQGSLENIAYTVSARELAVYVVETMERPNIITTAEIHLPKAELRADGGVEYILKQRSESSWLTRDETLRVRGIKCACIIGVNLHERKEKQVVVVDLKFSENFKFVLDSLLEIPANPVEIALEHSHEFIESVVKLVESSSYQTVEALASAICRDVTMRWEIPEIEVSVQKSYAIPSIGAAGVQIRRRKSFYAKSTSEKHSQKNK